jgi:hypothetical protein
VGGTFAPRVGFDGALTLRPQKPMTAVIILLSVLAVIAAYALALWLDAPPT